MADYWKSNDKKYCEYCKCWITDNKASISFHENGKRHRAAVANRITEIGKKSLKEEKEKIKFQNELRKMEEAAMKSYAGDLSTKADLTGQALLNANISIGPSPSTSGSSNDRQRIAQVDPMRLPGEDSDEERNCNNPKVIKKPIIEQPASESLWVEGLSDEGYTYYWNVKTYESVWQAPKEGFMTLKEYEKLNEIAKEKQQMQYAEEAKNFRENVDEEIAKFNRERLKLYRRPDPEETLKAKEEKRSRYKTEEDAKAPVIGKWEVVEEKKPEVVDLELPIVEQKWLPPVVSTDLYEPPVEKKFKEKTLNSLDSSFVAGVSGKFKKRKTPKGVMRQRLDDD